jgi:hypothetical protein
MSLPAWTEFRRGSVPPITEEQITGAMKSFPQLSRDAIEASFDDVLNDTIYVNSRYQVNVRYVNDVPGILGTIAHLSIKRLDKERIGPERYRDFMRIRDELMGTEREAVELYPARSREVDTANQYHLWVMPPLAVLPFGWHSGRNVVGDSNGGAKQHPFDEDHHAVD